MGKCTMNCETCDHKTRGDGGYCYMWREEPDGECFQHTGYKVQHNLKNYRPGSIYESAIEQAMQNWGMLR